MHTLSWDGSCLTLLNQTALPLKVEYLYCQNYQMVADAIRRLEVRGAPAIGVAAAFAFVLGAREAASKTLKDNFSNKLACIAEELKQTRPTAVNLFWAIDRMLDVARLLQNEKSMEIILEALEKEAMTIFDEDSHVNAQISRYGAQLFSSSTPIAVLTHCNAGALATAALGTALGIIRQAWQEGKIARVYADETRPLLQGARLTAWELSQDDIPVTLITDNMAGWVMKKKMVQAIIVGADRITLNGDVANKIGTYSLAVLAKEHNIPFYVAAPLSTFDFIMTTGDCIPIEERNPQEVTTFAGVTIAPEGVAVFNPAFDVTPNELVSAIITENGILKAPYSHSIAQLKREKGES